MSSSWALWMRTSASIELDDALCVPDQIPVDVSRREAVGKTPQQPRQVDDLPVGPAHRFEPVTVGQEFGDLRVDRAFVGAFVFDNLPRDDPIRL